MEEQGKRGRRKAIKVREYKTRNMALIRGWTLIQINTVTGPHCLQDTVDLKVLQYVTKVLTFQVNS